MAKKKNRLAGVTPANSSSGKASENRAPAQTASSKTTSNATVGKATAGKTVATAQRETPFDLHNVASFWPLAAGILLLGSLLRLVLLGSPIFHSDEAIHALFSYNFQDYNYDPVFHGPLLYHLVALVMKALGDGDFTARLVPAMLGIGLIAMVLLSARHWLGDRAALWSAALIAISPVMVTYSRRLLHDALVLVLTFGAVLYFQTAREKRAHTAAGFEARVGIIALSALFLATKANAFFVIGMLLAFWIATLLPFRSSPDFQRTFKFLPAIAFVVIGVAAHFALRKVPQEAHNETVLKYICILWVFAVGVWMTLAPKEYDNAKEDDQNVAKANADRNSDWEYATEVEGTNARANEASTLGQRDGRELLFVWLAPLTGLLVGAFLFAFFYGHGFLWLREPSSIASRWPEIKSAIPRMLEYWNGQQKQPRLPGPHDYYIVLLALYELPIVIAAIGGIWHASRHRTPFTDLLLWWAFTSFVAYAIANEKVPWLMTHQVLPFALLAGVWLGSLRIEKSGTRKALMVASAAGAVFLLRGTVATNFARAGDNHEPMFYAQTTEAYADCFFAASKMALEEGRDLSGNVWVHSDKQWPTAWYFRRINDEYKALAMYGGAPGPTPMRMALASKPAWDTQRGEGKFGNWRTWSYKPGVGAVVNPLGVEGALPDFFIWPRASWPALRPDRYTRWWLNRDATEENKVLSEWSHSEVVVATIR
jgi:uncharacterized protein (TIGR03663 family)